MSADLPDQMTAIAITTPGGAEVLQPVERSMPAPGHGELLIACAAAGINRPDVLQRQGGYPPPPGASDIPGLEIAGEVVAIGPGVVGWHIGDRACALVAGGGYATHCLAPAMQALPWPVGATAVTAAALPETVFTVWHNVFERGRLGAGERLLVHGGSSGIGTTAIQLAAALGARVFATAGSDAKCRACERLGAERAINYRSEDFVAVVKELTAGAGADLILDMVGGEYLARNLEALALEGRLVQIAFLKGPKVEVNLMRLMLKRQTITGSTLRARSIADKGAIAAAVRRHVWPLLEAGRVAPVIDSTFELREAAAAHIRMEGGEHIGKIVLTI